MWNCNDAVQCELTTLDLAKSLARDAISLRREYSTDLSIDEVHKLDKTVDHLISIVATAAERAAKLHQSGSSQAGRKTRTKK